MTWLLNHTINELRELYNNTNSDSTYDFYPIDDFVVHFNWMNYTREICLTLSNIYNQLANNLIPNHPVTKFFYNKCADMRGIMCVEMHEGYLITNKFYTMNVQDIKSPLLKYLAINYLLSNSRTRTLYLR